MVSIETARLYSHGLAYIPRKHIRQFLGEAPLITSPLCLLIVKPGSDNEDVARHVVFLLQEIYRLIGKKVEVKIEEVQ